MERKIQVLVKAARNLPPLEQRLVVPQQQIHDGLRTHFKSGGHRGALGGEQRFVQRITLHRPHRHQHHLGQRRDGVVGIGQGADQITDSRVDTQQQQRQQDLVAAREVAVNSRAGHTGLVRDFGHPDLGIAPTHDAPARGVQEPPAGLLVIEDRAVIAPPPARLHAVDATGYVVPRNIWQVAEPPGPVKH